LPLAIHRSAVVSQLDRLAVALRNDGICCPRSPRFPTKTEKLKLFTCFTATAPVNPTLLYYFPLRTTFRHIIDLLQFLSREIVHSAQYFLKNCYQRFQTDAARPVVLFFIVTHEELWHVFASRSLLASPRCVALTAA
jgi:hypothetical protein